MYFKNMFEFFFSHSPHSPPHMPHATFFLYISPAFILKICLSFFFSHSPHFPPPYATRHILPIYLTGMYFKNMFEFFSLSLAPFPPPICHTPHFFPPLEILFSCKSVRPRALRRALPSALAPAEHADRWALPHGSGRCVRRRRRWRHLSIRNRVHHRLESRTRAGRRVRSGRHVQSPVLLIHVND